MARLVPALEMMQEWLQDEEDDIPTKLEIPTTTDSKEISNLKHPLPHQSNKQDGPEGNNDWTCDQKEQSYNGPNHNQVNNTGDRNERDDSTRKDSHKQRSDGGDRNGTDGRTHNDGGSRFRSDERDGTGGRHNYESQRSDHNGERRNSDNNQRSDYSRDSNQDCNSENRPRRHEMISEEDNKINRNAFDRRSGNTANNRDTKLDIDNRRPFTNSRDNYQNTRREDDSNNRRHNRNSDQAKDNVNGGDNFNDRRRYQENWNHRRDNRNPEQVNDRPRRRDDGDDRSQSGDQRHRFDSRFNNDNSNMSSGKSERPEIYIPPEPSSKEEDIFNSGIATGINFENYNKIKIDITGDDIPEAITNFTSCGLSPLILENLKKCNYKQPTPIQKTAIPAIIAGRDLMACAQTGSGKTAGFLLPILNNLLNKDAVEIGKPIAIIMAPTRELAIQIADEARKYAYRSVIKTCIFYGGTSTHHQTLAFQKGCHILVATPGRLLDMLDRGVVSFDNVRFVVLDEADRMLDMGFKEDIRQMMDHRTMVHMNKRQTLMFSATFPVDVQRMAGNFLKKYIFIAVGIVGSACSDVQQTILEVKRVEKREKLTEILNDKSTSSSRTIVFCDTKRMTDTLAAFYSESDMQATSIHGDRNQQQREEVLADFRSGKMKILFATNVAARGLDIKNIDHVINYDVPKDIDEYVHRIGRTGRVGNRGKSTTFFDAEEDADVASALVNILKQANQPIPECLMLSQGGGDTPGMSHELKFGGKDYRKPRITGEELLKGHEPDEKWPKVFPVYALIN